MIEIGLGSLIGLAYFFGVFFLLTALWKFRFRISEFDLGENVLFLLIYVLPGLLLLLSLDKMYENQCEISLLGCTLGLLGFAIGFTVGAGIAFFIWRADLKHQAKYAADPIYRAECWLKQSFQYQSWAEYNCPVNKSYKKSAIEALEEALLIDPNRADVQAKLDELRNP